MKKILLLALMVPLMASAELTPSRGVFDARVRVVDYNPSDVVMLSTFYGVSTHVQFAQDEKIKDVAVGDDQAWNVVDRGNHLFIKPKATKADTNVTVVTDKRVYQFALVVQPRPIKDANAWRDPNLVFSLSFRYPDEETAKLNAKARQEQVDARLTEMKGKLSTALKQGENGDYWVAGSPEISPTAARDDGRFIYLAFSNNRDMPAVYTVEPDGSESLVNTNVVGNEIVIHRLVRKITLRKGNSVACVVNKSFDIDGGKDNTTGTIAPDVQRVIKGEK